MDQALKHRLPGGEFSSRAIGVSADGSIVVGMSKSSLGDEAFIWDLINGSAICEKYS